MISLRPVFLLSLAALLSSAAGVSSIRALQEGQVRTSVPPEIRSKDIGQKPRNVRNVGFSSHWMEANSSFSKRGTMELTIPELVTLGGTTAVSDIDSIYERGLFSFAWELTKVFLGGTTTGAIGNVLGWGCTILGFLSDKVPSWTTWPCGAIGFMSAFTNVYSGRGTITAAWNALQGTGATTGQEDDFMRWYGAMRAGYEKRGSCDWCYDMNNEVYAEVADRASGQLEGVHFHEFNDGLAVLPLQALMGSNESSAIPFAVSINGTLTHLGAKMWLESNGTHAGFVSIGLPAHLVNVSKTAKRDDPADVHYIMYDDDQGITLEGQDNSTEYGGYYGIYYGDYYYGDEDQFWEVDNDVGGEALDSNGAVYVGAGIATNMVQESATHACVCVQTGSNESWVSTGAVQLGTGPNSWSGYSQCWNSNCDT